MKLQYLGTAAAEGWPAVWCGCPLCEYAREKGGREVRTRSQSIVDDALLLDLPPDTYMHALLHGVPLHKITTLFITHSHGDHCYMNEVEMHYPPYCNKGAPCLNIYGNAGVEKQFNAIWEATDGEMEGYCSFTRLAPFDTVKVECDGKGYTVSALHALHGPPGEDSLNYLINDGEKTLLYGHDTGIYTEDTWAFLKGRRLDLVSLDCNYQGQRDGGNHMGLPDVLEVRQRMMEEGMSDESTVFVVNHFSHNSGWNHSEMTAHATAHNMLTSWDGMVVQV